MNIAIWVGLGGVLVATILGLIVFVRRRSVSPVKRLQAIPSAGSALVPVVKDGDADDPVAGALEPFHDATQIVVGPSAMAPVFSIAPLQGDVALPTARRLNLDDRSISRLNPLLQLVPNGLISSEMARGQFMEVVVNGSLAEAATGGGFRGFVRDSAGRFHEHANLFEPERLSAAVNGAMLFQLVSAVVAQKHLADISRKLGEIVEAVNRIEVFLQDERKSAVYGALEYLQQAASAISHGELSPAVRQLLEDQEAQLLKVEQHLFAELRSETEQTSSIKDPDTFGSEGLKRAIENHQDRLESLATQWLLCFRARCQAWYLLSAFADEIHLKAVRLKSLEDSVTRITAMDGPLHTIEKVMQIKIDTLDATFNWSSTLASYRTELRDRISGKLTGLRQASDVEMEHVRMGERLLIEQQQPMKLAIRMDGGQICEVRHLSAR